jgi:hypothetical protein
MRFITPALVFAAAAIFVAGCQSTHEKGVKSNLKTQWTTVDGDTRAATAAAADVLKEQELKDVKAESTNVDGKATGHMADGTKISVDVKKKTETTSQVSVNVGNFGDPELGAEIARKIKDRTASR